MLGEGLVTFLFLFIVMAATVNNGRQEVPENLVLGAIVTGFAAVALIYSFADVSGAHFNPAVTFATMVKMIIDKIMTINIQLTFLIFIYYYCTLHSSGYWKSICSKRIGIHDNSNHRLCIRNVMAYGRLS